MAQSEHSFCGLVEEARVRRLEASKPHPWIVRKFAVGLSLLIVGYTTYVYAARFCRDMIIQSRHALSNRVTGVAFLVVFSVLLLLTIWCYLVVVTTSPGHARQYTPTTTRPGYEHSNISSTFNSTDVRGTSYELTYPIPNPSRVPIHDAGRQSNAQSTSGSRQDRTVSSQISAAPSKLEQSPHSQASVRGLEEARATDVNGGFEPSRVPDTTMPPSHAHPYQSGSPFQPPMFTRRPTTTPVLLPEYRYCSKCQIVKPARTHHCRACGTCILKYDHHCPWIGQCVGAFNQKYFVNFLQWATIFCFWTFVTLLSLNVKPRPSTATELDPQQIVVIALVGLFGLFCSLLLISHLHLVLLNQTTVESLHFRSMRDREQELLSKMYKWYHLGAKRQTRKQWDNEWGRIGIEGNLWWLGSRKANWVAVMGKNVWWWILPVGRPLDDGMNYPTNPRFDGAGRWKRRKEWPPNLQ